MIGLSPILVAGMPAALAIGTAVFPFSFFVAGAGD
jgi:hypothetical protein